MNTQKVSIISTIVNLAFTVLKLVLGFLINSAALIADAIHSGLDVFSSFVTFLGIKSSKKPVDEKYPYGYYRTESLAGFVVTILLAITAVWILYEGISRFFVDERVEFSIWAIILMIASVIINGVMANIKFHYGHKEQSLSMVADAEHSRADAISSLGVLIGLILVKFFVLAENLLMNFQFDIRIVLHNWFSVRFSKVMERRMRKFEDF